MYAEVMNVQGLDSQSDAGDTESIPNKGLPTNALESIRGKTKKINGELKPIRYAVTSSCNVYGTNLRFTLLCLINYNSDCLLRLNWELQRSLILLLLILIFQSCWQEIFAKFMAWILEQSTSFLKL